MKRLRRLDFEEDPIEPDRKKDPSDDPKDYFPPSVGPAAQGRLRPLPAGVYNTHVLPGPDWIASGNGPQNANEWGWARMATFNELTTWCTEMLTFDPTWNRPPCSCGALIHELGGWHPQRSVVVDWPTTGTFYYKAGDTQWWDLYFDPERAHFDPGMLDAQVNTFNQILWNSTTPIDANIIDLHEARLCCPGLTRLYNGQSLVQVGTWLEDFVQRRGPQDAIVPIPLLPV